MASESGCPIEVHRIEIEKCDEMYDRECQGNKYIPFHRAGYDRKTGQSPNSPREQVSNSNVAKAWFPRTEAGGSTLLMAEPIIGLSTDRVLCGQFTS
jgi:hypothetical protein